MALPPPVILSVYRSKKPRVTWPSTEAFAACASDQDVDLIKQSIRSGRPALVGMDGENTVIKPEAEGDDEQTFESLFDGAIQLIDLQRMRDTGVENIGDVPPRTFIVETFFRFDIPLARMKIALSAPEHGDIGPRFRELMRTDPMFRQTVFERMLQWANLCLQEAEELTYGFDEAFEAGNPRSVVPALDPPLEKDGPGWRILDQ